MNTIGKLNIDFVENGSIPREKLGTDVIGYNTTASGQGSHAEGWSTTASNMCSHAEGYDTEAYGETSHAEGRYSIASGWVSHAEGNYTEASGNSSHAEGSSTDASGKAAHAEGELTNASGICSHAEGSEATASGNGSHAEGWNTTASGDYSHTEGSSTDASGDASHAEGYSTNASSAYSHAEGNETTAFGMCSHAEGNYTEASGNSSHAEGYGSTASGHGSHAEGGYHFYDSEKEKEYDIIGGYASGHGSHAEGGETVAYGNYSHVEGFDATAKGEASHAEGANTTAEGGASHAEGANTTAFGNYSHAGGFSTHVAGVTSFGHGNYVETTKDNEVAFGKFNVSGENTLFSIGNGTDSDNRSNAFEIKDNPNSEPVTVFKYAPRNITYTYTTEAGVTSIIFGAKYVDETADYVQYQIYSMGSLSYMIYLFSGQPASLSAMDYLYLPKNRPEFEMGYDHIFAYDTIRGLYISNSVFDSSTCLDVSKYYDEGGFEYSGKNVVEIQCETYLARVSGFIGNNRILTDMDLINENVDLSNYYTKSEIDQKIDNVSAGGPFSENNSHGISSNDCQATGDYSFAVGYSTKASGDYGSHAEGWSTTASGEASHAEGHNTNATVNYSHAEGWCTTAEGEASHAEGRGTEAYGIASHAEGSYTEASGDYSHAEGAETTASGDFSHAGGIHSVASGDGSFAHGNGVKATNSYEVAFGQYNLSVTDSTLFSIGAGTGINSKFNAFEIYRNDAGEIEGTLNGSNIVTNTKISTYTSSDGFYEIDLKPNEVVTCNIHEDSAIELHANLPNNDNTKKGLPYILYVEVRRGTFNDNTIYQFGVIDQAVGDSSTIVWANGNYPNFNTYNCVEMQFIKYNSKWLGTWVGYN